MNTNDFLGSWADENVSFATRIVKSASVGDNFWTAMVFVENSRYVNTTQTGWEKAPGTEDSQGIKVLAVDATNYANYTSGLLQSWLYDLFCNGFSGECILVACGNIASTSEDTYTPVTPVGTENPQEEGWYEETSTDVYELTTDTSVTQGKTYYTKTTVVTEDATAFIASLDIAYAALKA